MAGYVRVDTSNNIADGNVISATDLDNEFDGVQAGFNASTGHTHGGAAGEGAPITRLGPTQDVTISTSLMAPKTTNTVDLGSSSLRYKDLFLAGNATIGGTLGVTGATTLSAALTYGGVTLSNAVTGTGNMVLSTSPTLTTPALGTPSALVGTNITGTASGLTAGNVTTNANLTGAITSTGNATLLGSFSSANLAGALTDETGTGSAVFANSPTLVTPALGTPASGVVTNLTGTASININGTVGATTASTGNFTTLTTSGAVTHNAGTANGVAFLNASKVLTTGSALTFDGTNLGVGTSSPSGSAGYTYLSVNNATNGSVVSLRFSGAEKSAFYFDNASNTTNLFNNTTSGQLVFGVNSAEQMRLTSTGLGIGTSSPAAKLDVKGDFSLQATNSTNKWYLYTFTDNTLRWNYNGAGGDELVMDTSGNLGLGVTPSAWGGLLGKALQVGNSSISTNSADASAGYFGVNTYFDGTNFRYINSIQAELYAMEAGAHKWFNAPSGTAGNAISFTQAMTLDASGNLGVGTTSPTAPFTLAAANNFPFIHWNDSSNTTIAFAGWHGGGGGDDDFRIGTAGAKALTFRTNTTERARIDSSGNLLVGTTTALAKLTVFASSGDIFSSKTTGTSTGFVYSSDSTTTSDAAFFIKNSAGVGSIQCTSVATVYNTTSDYRLKTVIGPVANAGQRIDALRPIEYTWNSNGERTRGFLAHQFQEVYAGSVSGTKDAVDAEGKPVYQAMQASTSEVIADLVAELQSLRARVAQLESN